jgi:hypothetical protein
MSPSEEVNSAVGSAPARSENGKKIDVGQLLNEKREALSAARKGYANARAMRDEVAMGDFARLIDALKDLIPALETELAGVLEATGRKEAEDRLRGIKRGAGSLRAELKEDDARVRALEKELNERNAERTTRARKYDSFQAEASALSDRFELPAVKLDSVAEPPPIQVPTPWQYHVVRPSFEACEHNLRQRRDYAEIGGSDGYGIIMKAGLRPFRPLTQREREVLEDREEERRPDPVLAAAATEAIALGKLRVPGGHVHSG